MFSQFIRYPMSTSLISPHNDRQCLTQGFWLTHGSQRTALLDLVRPRLPHHTCLCHFSPPPATGEKVFPLLSLTTHFLLLSQSSCLQVTQPGAKLPSGPLAHFSRGICPHAHLLLLAFEPALPVLSLTLLMSPRCHPKGLSLHQVALGSNYPHCPWHGNRNVCAC